MSIPILRIMRSVQLIKEPMYQPERNVHDPKFIFRNYENKLQVPTHKSGNLPLAPEYFHIAPLKILNSYHLERTTSLFAL